MNYCIYSFYLLESQLIKVYMAGWNQIKYVLFFKQNIYWNLLAHELFESSLCYTDKLLFHTII